MLRVIISRFWSSVVSMVDANFDCVVSISGGLARHSERFFHPRDDEPEVERDRRVDRRPARPEYLTASGHARARLLVRGLDWLAKYADDEPDWADACLAALSGRDKDLTVWTYDREFQTTWRRLNGTAIPLAVRST
jgi:hypothetical protein